jgi:hypothetical protein
MKVYQTKMANILKMQNLTHSFQNQEKMCLLEINVHKYKNQYPKRISYSQIKLNEISIKIPKADSTISIEKQKTNI